MNIRAANSRNVLLLHGGALGDLILAYHFARQWTDNPSTGLGIVARNPIVAWMQTRGFVREGIRDDAVRAFELFARSVDRSIAIAECIGRYDVIINMLGGPDSAVHRNLQALGCRDVISIDPAPDASRMHIVYQWQQRVTAAAPRNFDSLRSAMDPEARRPFRQALHKRLGDERNVRIIHPGSGSRAKCGPLEWYESVFDNIADGWQHVWMIGPDEMERDGAALLERLKKRGPVLFEESIFVAADLVAGADAFCGNDSGMAHLAALIGLPTTAAFAATDPAVWKPIGRQVMALNQPWPTRPIAPA